MLAEVVTLTSSTSDLIMAVLRQRVEQQQHGIGWEKQSSCSTEAIQEIEAVTISMRRPSTGHLTVEVKAIPNLAVWQSKNRLGMVVRLQGEEHDVRKSRKLEFGADELMMFHFENYKKVGLEVFLTIEMYLLKCKGKSRQLLGCTVIQLQEEEKEKDEKDSEGQEERYRLHTTWEDRGRGELRELEARTDARAKAFVTG